MSESTGHSASDFLTPIQERRERVFLILAGTFLCAMTLLNIIGITRFIQLGFEEWGYLVVAVGVLPYPVTFLCTDLICELYGRARASFLVWVGLGLNFFILGCMYLGNSVAAADAAPPWQTLQLAEAVALPSGVTVESSVELFALMYACTSGAVFASMLAYITAQYCDVQLFHFWKWVTRGKHLWVRNNFSTLLSQWVDSFMVVAVTFGALWWAGNPDFTTGAMLVLMASSYVFKAMVAAADTLPFYVLTAWLRRYLELPGADEQTGDAEPAH